MTVQCCDDSTEEVVGSNVLFPFIILQRKTHVTLLYLPFPLTEPIINSKVRLRNQREVELEIVHGANEAGAR